MLSDGTRHIDFQTVEHYDLQGRRTMRRIAWTASEPGLPDFEASQLLAGEGLELDAVDAALVGKISSYLSEAS